MIQNYHTTTLPNGLKVIQEYSPSNVVYCGYVVCAGTRDEADNESGMAHFCEHMSFKGTFHRSAWQVANELEKVGGDLNAYTTKEETVYYAAVLKNDFTRAVRLLSDIVLSSTYPQREIEKEVEVICDEIQSYEDTPSELIFDEFEEMLFPAHPLGRSILGRAERLREYVTADAWCFTQRHYQPANLCFFVYGDVDFSVLERTLLRLTLDRETSSVALPSVAPSPYQPIEREVKKDTHQAHVVMGGRAYSAYDNRRIGLFLLGNLLGGPGMNSRLNQSLRERSGLVYNVESFHTSYTDTGEWGIYFGCDEHDVKRCRKKVLHELSRLVDAPLTPAQLSAAQKQLKGQIGVSCDNFENYALAMGKTFAHYGHHRDIDLLCGQIDALTPQSLQEIAADLFRPEQLTTLIYH